jgi:hypothetical protein
VVWSVYERIVISKGTPLSPPLSLSPFIFNTHTYTHDCDVTKGFSLVAHSCN